MLGGVCFFFFYLVCQPWTQSSICINKLQSTQHLNCLSISISAEPIVGGSNAFQDFPMLIWMEY